MKFEYPNGATPLDPDEASGLLPAHITTHAQLNEWEHANILEAEKWAFARRHTHFLAMPFCTKLHEKMFDQTWEWAGTFRRSNKNIGVFWEQVSTQLKLLLDDVQFQLENRSYDVDEIAARFHHRLVAIHPFPNGNGRHARLMADVLLFNRGTKRFSWGQARPFSSTVTRNAYIDSLKKADRGDYASLLRFVRS